MTCTEKWRGVHSKLSLMSTSRPYFLLRNISIESVPLSNCAAQCIMLRPFVVREEGSALKS